MFPKRRLAYAQGYLELGMLAEAAAELNQLTGPDAESLAALGLRLALLQELQDWPALRDLARYVVAQNPGHAGAWVTWAYATRRAESLAAAEQILLAAEEQHPTEATIQFNLGCYACQRGDLANARRRVDRAIALEPTFAEAAAADPDLEPLRALAK
jgi:Tfp pilus assembly protein PilF